MIPKPSGDPAPRPDETTTFASASETPPRVRLGLLGDADDLVCVGERRREALDGWFSRRGRLGGDGVRRGCEERRGAVNVRLLEKAAAPAQSSHAHGVAGRRGNAVRSERDVETGSDVGVHLVSPLAAGSDDRRRLKPLGELDGGLSDRGRRIRAEDLVLGDVDGRDSMLPQLRDITL